MRKNTARKWVHLLLDLLPVLIIPIFAIYLINHSPQGLQVQSGGYEITNQYQTNDINDVNDIVLGNLYKYNRQLTEDLEIGFDTNTMTLIDYKLENILNFNNDVISYNEFIISSLEGIDYIVLDFNNDTLSLHADNVDDEDCIQISKIVNNEDVYITFYFYYVQINDNQYIDINYIFSSDYLGTDYTYNEGMIYDNTDIGSQLIYSMYIPVHDYFNMTNLFNFGDIYIWINNSMFSGNAPLPIFIVYNVIVYEFLIDLIFLIYSIFMFIIDFSSELLARCFSFSNKGGTR